MDTSAFSSTLEVEVLATLASASAPVFTLSRVSKKVNPVVWRQGVDFS